jgi:hypothetical protein
MFFEVGLVLPLAGGCTCLSISAVLLWPSTFICVTCHPTLTIQLSNNPTSIKGPFLIYSLFILKFFKIEDFVDRYLAGTRDFCLFLTLLTDSTASFSG